MSTGGTTLLRMRKTEGEEEGLLKLQEKVGGPEECNNCTAEGTVLSARLSRADTSTLRAARGRDIPLVLLT